MNIPISDEVLVQILLAWANLLTAGWLKASSTSGGVALWAVISG